MYEFGRSGRWVLPGLLGAALCSCDKPDDGRVPVFPVHGTVLVQGQPATGALVVFHPVDRTEPSTVTPHGRVQQDGSFQLTTYDSGDGAPSGQYAVTLFWPEPPKSPVADPDSGPDRLRGRYADPQKSALRVRVSESDNQLEPFRLE